LDALKVQGLNGDAVRFRFAEVEGQSIQSFDETGLSYPASPDHNEFALGQGTGPLPLNTKVVVEDGSGGGGLGLIDKGVTREARPYKIL
jgi:hypothetical protein